MDHILIYMTCRDEAEAQKIVMALLEKNLIACANVMPPHRSWYRWEGKVESGQEVAVIMKTRSALFDAVQEEVCRQHSYECPCIIALNVTKGHEPFLEWIGDQTLSG